MHFTQIEHRLFSNISMNWRARPLTSHEVIVNTIAATTTATGLKVRAVLDTRDYPAGVKIGDKQMRQLTQDGRWVQPRLARRVELHPPPRAHSHRLRCRR